MKYTSEYKEARNRLDMIVVKQGLRNTPQRYAVLLVICNMKCPLSVSRIYDAIKAKGHKMARCTVYNIVDFFVDNGILEEQPKLLTIKKFI